MATPTRVNLPAVVAPCTRGTIALTPNMLGIEHWDRLENGALFAGAKHTDWARLLTRTFVRRCLVCGGRLRIVSVHDHGDRRTPCSSHWVFRQTRHASAALAIRRAAVED